MLIIIIVFSIITFFLFGYDKRAAKLGHWRIPEKVLLGMSILGGALGGLAGMVIFHHKTRKTYFWVICILASLVHVYLLIFTPKSSLQTWKFMLAFV
ncbi:MAG: DUF1294 domain-containing protein [Anaerolineaceae bacterium]